MDVWWTSIGEPSLITGAALGTLWAVLSTWRRRHRFKIRGLRPTAQIRWFLSAGLGMGSFLALVAAVALLAIEDMLPTMGVWFMLGTASLSFCSALLFGRFEEPAALREFVDMEPELMVVNERRAAAVHATEPIASTAESPASPAAAEHG